MGERFFVCKSITNSQDLDVKKFIPRNLQCYKAVTCFTKTHGDFFYIEVLSVECGFTSLNY